MNSPHKFSERSTSETSLHIEGINTLASAVKTGRHEIEDQNTVSESVAGPPSKSQTACSFAEPHWFHCILRTNASGEMSDLLINYVVLSILSFRRTWETIVCLFFLS